MPTSCCVVGCRSSGYKDGRKFFAFPLLQYRSDRALELSQTRQKAWVGAINRVGFGSDKFKHARVCDLHFVSGRSAKLSDVSDVDWVPTLNMGYEVETVERKLCRLCLEYGEDFVNVSETFQDLTIDSILTKHFWFQVNEKDNMPEWLCQGCWTQVKMFHTFHQRAEVRYLNYYCRAKDFVEICFDNQEEEEAEASELDLNLVKQKVRELQTPTTDQSISGEANCANDDNSCNETENSYTSNEVQRISDESMDDCNTIIVERLQVEIGLRGHITQNYQSRAKAVRINCPICDKEMKSKHTLSRHIKNVHGKRDHRCSFCKKTFMTVKTLKEHIACHLTAN